ncbi:major facilitator superfamily domain-containing protein [Apodospora peruviana]|uniref:Major facilitator superfamily domain-containing protein n=1 Tax=Apodospora peruviana TaxID=516989 RepID=A0AAE0IS66_9PEZI|nr:major facilitator superfamily domain-containing protein [Apodospora peruviana]
MFLPWRSHPLFIVLTVGIGQFSDQFLFGMRIPLLPLLVHEHLHIPDLDSPEIQRLVANILAAFSIATLVSAVPAGWLADFRALRGHLYLAGLGALLWSTITFYTSESYAVMLFSRTLNGLSAAILYAAGYAIVADSVPKNDLGKALGTIRSVVAVGEISGPPLGGIIFSRWGFDGILNVSLFVLFIDLAMRMLMIEKPAASGSSSSSSETSALLQKTAHVSTTATGMLESEEALLSQQPAAGGESATENDDDVLLLIPDVLEIVSSRSSQGEIDSYPTPILTYHSKTSLSRRFLPSILFHLVDPQLLVCLLLSMMQYIILGSYDSTLALELESSTSPGESRNRSWNGFGLPPEKVGFVYLALAIPTLVFAPVAGWAVDRFGPRIVATLGYGCFVPSLVGMVVPAGHFFPHESVNLGLFSLGLSMQGLCLAMVSTPGMVKAKEVVERRAALAAARRSEIGRTCESDCENSGSDDCKPAATNDGSEKDSVMGQLFGLNTMVTSFGLLVGNYAGAELRARLSYGGMEMVLAGLCAVSGTLAWLIFTDQDDDHGDGFMPVMQG